MRWYAAFAPLGAALVAVMAAGVIGAHGGDTWCASNSFSCSLQTNVIGVVAIGGVTTYWYYGFRRSRLLARYRRELRVRLAATDVRGSPAIDHLNVVQRQVSAAFRDARVPAGFVILTGPAGSGKADVLELTISGLAGSGSWVVPIPLGEIGAGGPADLLDAARQELGLLLLGVNANDDLVDALWRSLLRCERVLFVVPDIENIAPAASSSERQIVVHRMFASAERLRVPILGTGRPNLVDSLRGTVIELPRLSDELVRRLLRTLGQRDGGVLSLLEGAMVGSLATPLMIERVGWLLRRSGDDVVAALCSVPLSARDLALWDLLLREHVVPGSAMGADELRIVAFALMTTGRFEVSIPDSEEWQAAVELAREVGMRLRETGPSDAEVRSYAEGGFLDDSSSRHLLRFASPDVQAVVAAGFLVSVPDRIGEIIEQLPVSAAARSCVEASLRLDADAGRVHRALLDAVTADTSAGAEAAALGLALTWAPSPEDPHVEAELARRLALALADRATGAGGPVLSTAGMRDAVTVLDGHVHNDAEKYLLQALHSSSFPVRLSVALALLRRDSPRELLDSVEGWISAAESPAASGVQHQLGLALWFCPYLREFAPDGRGAELFRRGRQLAMAADSNPLMFETSLCRGFKLAAWVHPDAGPDPAAVDLLTATPRFWYSRISLVHALGIRLASPQATAGGQDTVDRAYAALRTSAHDDPHPLVRHAAALVLRGLADHAPPASFAWLAETDMARSNTELADEPLRLLGDVSLFLNLIYCAEPWSDTLWRFLATSNDLPACIGRPDTRTAAMRTGCPPTCVFELCPYPGPARRGRGRGELSGSFCRTQKDLAARLSAAAWQTRSPKRVLTDFWAYAEENLANRDGWEINL